jgi:hypothetical protein
MANLELTPEDKKHPFSEWDEIELGKTVKYAMLRCKDKAQERQRLLMSAGVLMAVHEASKSKWLYGTLETTILNDKTGKPEYWSVTLRRNVWWKDLIRKFFLTLFPFMQ